VCALAFTYVFFFVCLHLFFHFCKWFVLFQFPLCFIFVLQMVCTTSTFLCIIVVPLVSLGFSLLLCSCTIWLPSIARLLHYFVWLLHYLTQLAKYQFDCQLLVALFNTSIAQLLLALFDTPCVGGDSPSSFCVGVSWGFKLRASKTKLV
jgi:hypothetical protein